MMTRKTSLIILVGLSALNAVGAGGIVGSKHDFSQRGWSQRQVCLPCHTPHNAGAAQVAPLWDRSPSSQESYTLFDGRRGQPGPASLVCLSCHDGSTAIDSFGGMSGNVFIQDINNRAQIGDRGDLRGNHPIGIKYPDFDRGYRLSTQIKAEGKVVLPRGRVECLSCHDVHNQYGGEKLLVKSNNGSALCLTCHRK